MVDKERIIMQMRVLGRGVPATRFLDFFTDQLRGSISVGFVSLSIHRIFHIGNLLYRGIRFQTEKEDTPDLS